MVLVLCPGLATYEERQSPVNNMAHDPHYSYYSPGLRHVDTAIPFTLETIEYDGRFRNHSLELLTNRRRWKKWTICHPCVRRTQL